MSSQLDSLALEEAHFLPVKCPYVPDHARYIPLDWWPKREIQDRLAFYGQPHYMSPYAPKAGTLHTVKLLWGARGDPERQHAIYILAALHDFEKHLPDRWHGDQYRLVMKVSEAADRQWRGKISDWHHAAKCAMPVHMTEAYYGADELLLPKDADDLMYIAAVEAALSAANWQLVEFVEDAPPSFQLIK